VVIERRSAFVARNRGRKMQAGAVAIACMFISLRVSFRGRGSRVKVISLYFFVRVLLK